MVGGLMATVIKMLLLLQGVGILVFFGLFAMVAERSWHRSVSS